MEEKQINIALSGWSGTGTSTTTLMLALLWERVYIPLTSVFREVGKELGSLDKEHEDRDLPAFESYIQPLIGKTVDRYADFKLVNGSGIILESDICAFRIGKRPEVFSIFLKADSQARYERFKADDRSGNGSEILKERDRVLREEYMKLWNIDIFDEELINEKYDLVIDTNELPIKPVLEVISGNLKERIELPNQSSWGEFEEKLSRVSSFEKSQLIEELAQKQLIMSTQEIMKEMSEVFAEEVAGYPEEVRRLF